MLTSAKQDRLSKNGCDIVASPANVLTAYLEKSPIVKAVIGDLINLLKEPNLPPEERAWAESSLEDALFRHRSLPRGASTGGVCAGDKASLPGLREAHQRMEEEERVFAQRLGLLLEKSQVSQAELARRIGVGPSAISMMLSRRCRPQRRTVEKIAQALGVQFQELWPV